MYLEFYMKNQMMMKELYFDMTKEKARKENL